MICKSLLVGAIGLCCLTGATVAYAGPPIVNTTFETDPGDWKVMNIANQPTDAAKLGITHEAANVKEGKGSLKFDYTIKKGDTNVLMLPLQPPSLVKMQSIHFWVKTDHATSVLLFVSEHDGGRYKTIFTCPANTWQEVSVGLSDLVLSEDDNDPKDPDGKLDPDQIEGLAIVDADCFLAQILGDTPDIINLPVGAHSVYINDFTIDDTVLPSGPAAVPGELSLTPLVRPQADWLVIGDATVQKTSEKPLTGPSVKVTYTQTKGKFSALIKPVKTGSFTGVTSIDFAAATKLPVSLIVQVEETNGNKYNTTIMLPGESQASDYTLKLSDFTAAQDSKDPSAKMDLALVKQVMLLDATGFGDIEQKANTLWINKLRAIKH